MANNEWYFLLQNDSYFWFLPEYDSRSTTCTYYVQGTASEMYVCRNYWGKKQ